MSPRSPRCGPLAAAGLLAVLLAGCASAPTAPSRPDVPASEAAFLLPPTSGYEPAVDPATRRLLADAHRRLIEQGDAAAARAAAESALAGDPDLAPAQVLLAQAELVEGLFPAAAERLRPVVADAPGYVAAQLARARALDLAGELPEAAEAYGEVRGVPAASERHEEILPRAAEIVANRLEEALARGRVEEAREALERLEAWRRDEPGVVRARAAVAAAAGERPAELEALRRLTSLGAADEEEEVRRAVLESEVGDAGAGLRLLEELASRSPDDPELAAELAHARFRWRLQLLPGAVQELATMPELSRADFASLLFWLFPSIRYGGSGNARIATDILDHPRKDEIVRVVNAGIMGIDPSLHLFRPERSVVRREVLAALLGLLARGSPRPACLGDFRSGRASAEQVCAAAARCGLLAEPSACLPQGTVSGSWAVEAGRAAQQRLGLE